MEREVGGMGIPRLSDQINVDKWAMMVRCIYSDAATSTATLGILNRCLRMGQTDTDTGCEATVQPTNIPHHMTRLLELKEESGYYLRRSGAFTEGTPSQSINELPLPDTKGLRTKLVDYRITTLADLMIIGIAGNSWNIQLCQQFPTIVPLLPSCPQGARILRPGQYWASSYYGGQEGRIVEIMGVYRNIINGRSWLPAIPSNTWPSVNRQRNRLSWVTPMLPFDSRGAGATEQFNVVDFFSGQLMLVQLSEEVPKLRKVDGKDIRCVARAIRSCHFEDPPQLTGETVNVGSPLLTQWESWIEQRESNLVEVFTDGALRYRNSVATTVLEQPTALRQPVFVQGGILFHFGHQSQLLASDNITITVEQGLEVELLSPSSIELYTILLAVRLMKHSRLHGVIHTDFVEATKISSRSNLRNLGRKANLPIYETIVALLEQTPTIRIQHVKAHGPIKGKSSWTREQFGNYYADRIAKGIEEDIAYNHLRWPVPELETLVMSTSKWHWITKERHLLLEPIGSLIQHKTLNTYLLDRDIYRLKRGDNEKWQQAHLGYISDVWKPRTMKLSKLATMSRILWDKGWHGGNRAKSTCPMNSEPADWIGCGDCGLPDSQSHWIRECMEETTRAIRAEAKEQARDQLEAIQTSKGSKTLRDEIFNACSNLVEAAFNGEGGEQIWLGILPGHVVQELTPLLSTREFTSDKMDCPNKWRHTIKKVLKPLVLGANKMWRGKEERRCLKLMGLKVQAAQNRLVARRRCRNHDIRVLFRRAALRSAKQGNGTIQQDIDTTPCHQLLNDPNTAPIHAARRLQRLNTVRALKNRRTGKHRWVPTLEQEYFSRNRNHSYQILKKLTGKGPEHWRTIRFRTYDRLTDMEWLLGEEGAYEERATANKMTHSLEMKVSSEVDSIDYTHACNDSDCSASMLNNNVLLITSCRTGIG